MFDCLAVYDGLMKPIVLKTLVEVEQVFQALNYTDHQLEITEPEMLGSSISNETKAHTVIAAYEKHIDVLLLMFGVYCYDDPQRVDIFYKAEVLHFLSAVTELDNVDILTQILSDNVEDEDEDIFCALMEGIVGQPEAYHVDRIESVDENLINKMKTSTASPAFFGDVIENTKRTKMKLAAFLDGRTKGIIYETVINSSSLPLTYASTTANLLKSLPDLSASDIAFEVIAMLIATGTDKSEIPDLGRELITTTLDGDGKLSMAISKFNMMLSEVPDDDDEQE